MLLQRLQESERERGIVEMHFHSRERAPEVGVTLPLIAVALNLGDELAQVVDSLEQNAGLPFGCHEARNSMSRSRRRTGLNSTENNGRPLGH